MDDLEKSIDRVIILRSSVLKHAIRELTLQEVGKVELHLMETIDKFNNDHATLKSEFRKIGELLMNEKWIVFDDMRKQKKHALK